MDSRRQNFLRYLGQTSDSPLMLEIERAEGVYLYDKDGNVYLDLISGISVNNLGHRHPEVLRAISRQLDKYLHLMVYGEFIQEPAVDLAQLLASILPAALSSVYFVNSGSEAVEGAMKLAKRCTGRSEIITFKKGYHGSTHGPLSVMGDEYFKNSFRPLLPGIQLLDFNDPGQLDEITSKTACVLVEPVQGEAGIIPPDDDFLSLIRKKCDQTGTLLVFDEVQTGFGRTGSMFAFESFRVTPDILILAKGLGGGMPLGAFISSPEIMSALKSKPHLGHITTFGGHPVSCAAGLASLKTLLEEKIIEEVHSKGQLFRSLLIHPAIKTVRGMGLFLALEMGNAGLVRNVISKAVSKGVVLDWFLFCDHAIRITPPLIITGEQITDAVTIINEAIRESTDE